MSHELTAHQRQTVKLARVQETLNLFNSIADQLQEDGLTNAELATVAAHILFEIWSNPNRAEFAKLWKESGGEWLPGDPTDSQ